MFKSDLAFLLDVSKLQSLFEVQEGIISQTISDKAQLHDFCLEFFLMNSPHEVILCLSILTYY